MTMATPIDGAYRSPETIQNAVAAVGTGTILKKLEHYNVVFCDVTISASATVTFEGSSINGTMTALRAINVSTGAMATTATATGLYIVITMGTPWFQARVSTFGSGNITVVATPEFTTALGGTASTALSDSLANPTTGGTGAYLLLWDGTSAWVRGRSASGNVDNNGNGVNGLWTSSRNHMANTNAGSWERQRSNSDDTILASAARTVETNSADLTNYNGTSAHVVIDVTVFNGNITPVIEGKDALSGKYYEILRGVAITGTGTTVLKVGPGVAASANAAAQDKLPRTWRVQIEVAGGSSNTYSVGASVGGL